MQTGEALYREALAFYDRDELTLAAAAFLRVLAMDPAHIPARYKLANARKAQGDLIAAETLYRDVLQRDAGHAESFNNLGAVQEALQRPAEAEASYRRAIQCNPRLSQPYANLGRLLQAQGLGHDAADVYRSALQQGFSPGLFEHLLDAATGNSSAKAPAGYVSATFDAFADGFDQRLTHELDYRVPAQLAAMAEGYFIARAPHVLDLGCGTGLVGAELARRARSSGGSLVGVDLSPRMLEAARQRGCYDELHSAEIEAWLAHAPPAHFDVVIAADVFIYIGDLARLFERVAACLRPSGGFAFSVETCDGDDWCLLPSGRYAQSPGYLDGLAARHGFVVTSRLPAIIRRGVPGELILLARLPEA